ncbi:hypothetical protein QP531_06730 [Peptoniphilus harei]|uniref:hypothetical protein n=1 Tax=Peptoniphilus harei TaxID=54005 RepID=UPI00254E2F8B|nr:hypothetical protein [Peptoniphilus harei]MDK7377512.1 hypothetical protein [Peptoniphilus harei]MDK7679824.1 hypothetical protein [Peptoniphilus harei]
MRTVEFITEVENLGFKAIKSEKLIEIYDQQNTLLIKVREDIEFGIDTMHSKLKEFDPIIKKNLINLVFEYAATPIKNRGLYLGELREETAIKVQKYIDGNLGRLEDIDLETNNEGLTLKIKINPDEQTVTVDDDYEEWEQEALEDESDNKIVMLPQGRLTELPVLRVKDSSYDNCNVEFKVVGDNVHDQYVLGKDGGLHYLNTHCYAGTEYGEMKFDVKEDEEYGKVFESWNFFELMEHDARRLKIIDDSNYKRHKQAISNLFNLAFKERERKNKEVITNYLRGHRC